jgi:hypothetical protein
MKLLQEIFQKSVVKFSKYPTRSSTVQMMKINV